MCALRRNTIALVSLYCSRLLTCLSLLLDGELNDHRDRVYLAHSCQPQVTPFMAHSGSSGAICYMNKDTNLALSLT